ncbi:hypothetical protein ABPG74_004959 [Tetrahymena malaccensis]
MKVDYEQKKFHNQMPSRSILICQDEQDNLRSFFVKNAANIDNTNDDIEKEIVEIQSFIRANDKNYKDDENDISDVESNNDDSDHDVQDNQKMGDNEADQQDQEIGQFIQLKLKQVESGTLNLKINENNKEQGTDTFFNSEKQEQLRNRLSDSKNNILQKQQDNQEEKMQFPQQKNLSQTINERKLVEFNIKIIMKNQKQDQNLILEYGNFLDLIEEEDQKQKTTIQDLEEDKYLSRLEEGTADFYNYLFLDIKNEESLNEEEKEQLKQIKFKKSVQSIEQDIFRKKKFDSFIIEKCFSSKKNPKKVKKRIELIINKFHFEDIPSFVYLLNVIDQYYSIITSIKFMRLGRIKDNLFSMLFQKLRDLDRIQVLLFYDTSLYPENLEEIKLFMNWKLGQVKKIGFVQNFLNQLDLNFLFDTSLTKYPRTNSQLNDIYLLKHFNSNLVKSYSLIMVDQNQISLNLQQLIQQNSKSISQKGIQYSSNLGYDFKLDQDKFEELDLDIQWLSIKHSIENDQIENLTIDYYKIFTIDNKDNVFDLTIYSRKSLKDIEINLMYININHVERILSQRKNIGMYSLKILSNIDTYLKDLKLRDLLVHKYVGQTLTILNFDILFIPTLEIISLILKSEISQLSYGLNKCAPYLKRFKIQADIGYLINMNNLLQGVEWIKFKQLQKIVFQKCKF